MITRNLMKIIKNFWKLFFELEAAVGFEPTNKGFADLRLRPLGNAAKKESRLCRDLSGKRDSNPRHQPWQGCALPTELFPHK